MELIAALLIVAFFVGLNEVRVALLGKEDTSSEVFIAFSTLVIGFLFSLITSA